MIHYVNLSVIFEARSKSYYLLTVGHVTHGYSLLLTVTHCYSRLLTATLLTVTHGYLSESIVIYSFYLP